MLKPNEFNENQLDFFKELQNIGGSHAVTALSTLLGQSITIRVPRAQLFSFENICDVVEGPETLVTALLIELSGEINGCILLIQKAEDSRLLAQALLQSMGMEEEANQDELFSEMQLSALLEVSNILSGSFVTAIASLSGLRIDCSVPHMAVDYAAAVMNLPATMYGDYGDTVLFLQTQFDSERASMPGHFFLIPDVPSFDLLIRKMRV